MREKADTEIKIWRKMKASLVREDVTAGQREREIKGQKRKVIILKV